MFIKRSTTDQQTEKTENGRITKRIFNYTMGLGYGIGLLLTYSAYVFELDSQQCYLCNQLVEVFPFIDIAAAKSDYPHVMRIMWLYFTISTPLTFLGFFSTFPYLEYKTTSGWAFIYLTFLSVTMMLWVIYIILNGFVITGSTGRIFMHTLWGAFHISYLLFFGISFFSFILIMLPIAYQKQ